MQVFELAKVAEIAGIKRSRLKNWVLGKTALKIVPSVEVGLRRLFSAEDVFKVVVAAKLDAAGLKKQAINDVLGLLPEQPVSPLFVQRQKGQWRVSVAAEAGELRIELDLSEVLVKIGRQA